MSELYKILYIRMYVYDRVSLFYTADNKQYGVTYYLKNKLEIQPLPVPLPDTFYLPVTVIFYILLCFPKQYK